MGRPQSQRQRFRLTGVGAVIGMALTAAVALVAAAGAFSTQRLGNRILTETVAREMTSAQETLRTSLDSEIKRAVSMAHVIASNAQIQARFAAGDRDALAAATVPGFAALKANDGVVQLQFHVAPATSFLRAHRPEKFGDDLSSFRFTVVEANKSGKPVFGLENGVEGLGVRGVMPVRFEGKAVGTVEVGLNFGQAFFDAFLTPHSVCRPPRLNDTGNLSATVAMVIMQPAKGTMEVAPLPAFNRIFTRYSLTDEPMTLAQAAE